MLPSRREAPALGAVTPATIRAIVFVPSLSVAPGRVFLVLHREIVLDLRSVEDRARGQENRNQVTRRTVVGRDPEDPDDGGAIPNRDHRVAIGVGHHRLACVDVSARDHLGDSLDAHRLSASWVVGQQDADSYLPGPAEHDVTRTIGSCGHEAELVSREVGRVQEGQVAPVVGADVVGRLGVQPETVSLYLTSQQLLSRNVVGALDPGVGVGDQPVKSLDVALGRRPHGHHPGAGLCDVRQRSRLIGRQPGP